MTTRRHLQPVPDARAGRAAVYIRVSAVGAREVEQFHSPDLQYRAVTDMLTRRGLREVARIEDIDRTGRDFNRDGIRRVLMMARDREVDVVAVYDLSRVGRNTGETLRVINELRQFGVTVISTVEQIDDSPEGQFMLGQFLGMAQLYSDQMGRRWRQVHEHMAADGRQVGQPPLGYVQADTGHVTARGRTVRAGPTQVDPVLGPAVTRAFADYAAGLRVRDIAQRLGDLRGRPVWPAQVRKMLRNRFYLGFVTYKGSEHRGQHRPLVDEVTWAATARRITLDAKTPSRRLQVAHSLSGVAVCDACDAKAQLRSSAEGRAGRVQRLGCPRQSDLRTCAGCGSMRLADVEAEVLVQLGEYLRLLRVDSAAAAERRARQATSRADVARLRAELKRVKEAHRRLVEDRAFRDTPADVFADTNRELSAAAERLERAIAAAEVGQGLPPRKAVAALVELLELWPRASAAQRNRMLRATVAQVRLRSASAYREPAAERVEVVPL